MMYTPMLFEVEDYSYVRLSGISKMAACKLRHMLFRMDFWLQATIFEFSFFSPSQQFNIITNINICSIELK